MKLTFHGAAADAAADLLFRSGFGDSLADIGGIISLDHNNRYTVELADDRVSMLSTGEHLLWGLLVSLLGGPAPSLYDLADRLDHRTQVAVAAMFSSLFGLQHDLERVTYEVPC